MGSHPLLLPTPNPRTVSPLLSVYIFLFCAFHVNGVLQHVGFCDRLPALCRCLQGSSKVLLDQNSTLLRDEAFYTPFCLSTHQLMDIRIMNNAAIDVQVSV